MEAARSLLEGGKLELPHLPLPVPAVYAITVTVMLAITSQSIEWSTLVTLYRVRCANKKQKVGTVPLHLTPQRAPHSGIIT
jgi:hypothetical protein